MSKDEDRPLSFEEDPGPHFKAIVQTPAGPMERHYVDANIHSEDLQARVLASARAPARKATLARRKTVGLPADGLRIGYAFWGFLGDQKMDESGNHLSTPDGNATYSWSIVWEAMQRGHRVIPMMLDRDRHACRHIGNKNFGAFATEFRKSAYTHLNQNGEVFDSWKGFPELDILLIEWRFPIPGRNTPEDKGKPDYQPDLERQEELLRHYCTTKTKVVVWDLDYKLTEADERSLDRDGQVSAIIETSVAPKSVVIPRYSVQPPVLVDCLNEHPTVKATTLLSYIGSRYERDDVIDEWIRPIANRDDGRGRIHFYGNWLKDLRDCQRRWPGVVFHDRVTTTDFRKILRVSAGVPLLAKREYMERGFVTPRIWEALMFGSLPIGLTGHTGISRYTPLVAKDADDLLRLSMELRELSVKERAELRSKCIESIRFMDVSNFVDTLEALSK